MIEISGTIRRITFHNPENGHTVARMMVAGRDAPVTIVGKLMSVYAGEQISVRGDWRTHKKYGREFIIKDFRPLRPQTLDAIEKYLGCGLIKGIGPVLAGRLVAKFGLETISVIEADISRLTEVEGIGTARLGMIVKAWREHKEMRETLLFFGRYDVGLTNVIKIFHQYGKASIAVVSENPYRLIREVRGIGFETADKIAWQMNIPRDSSLRIRAGLIFILKRAAEDGHVFCPYGYLLGKCGELLHLRKELLIKEIVAMSRLEEIIIEKEEAG